MRLGLLKLEGCRGVRRDEAGALAAFLNAAKQGDAYGQYLAGRLLLDDGDARRAIALWEAAADQGLGVILGSGGPGLLYLYKRVCRPPGGRGGAGEG